MSEKIISLEEGDNKKQRRKGYIAGVRKELKMVSWTKRQELLKSTKIVVSSIFLFGIGVYFADLLVQGAINGLGSFVSRFFG